MKKLISFFILASCLTQGMAEAAIAQSQYDTFDEAATALQKAKDSNNPEQALMVLARLGGWKDNRGLARLVQQVTKLAGEQPPFIPVNPPARGGLSQEVKNAAAAVGDAVKAVDAAAVGLTDKKAVNDAINAAAGRQVNLIK